MSRSFFVSLISLLSIVCIIPANFIEKLKMLQEILKWFKFEKNQKKKFFKPQNCNAK